MNDPTTTQEHINKIIEFRQALYEHGFGRRRDALFETLDALLLAGRVDSVAMLSLDPRVKRRWQSLYKALEKGELNEAWLTTHLARQVPRVEVQYFSLDGTAWPRPRARTLDDRQYRAGLVESVKHAAIRDTDYFAFFETNIDAILNKDMAVLEQIAMTNCRIKAEVVQQDPTEKNMRRILNYGHTIGHAVESASGFDLLHGESVGIGMIAAGKLEKALGLVADDRLERIEQLLVKLGMPTVIPSEIKKEQLMGLLGKDKKAIGQWPRFILLESLGKALCKNGQWAHEVSRDMVDKCLDD